MRVRLRCASEAKVSFISSTLPTELPPQHPPFQLSLSLSRSTNLNLFLHFTSFLDFTLVSTRSPEVPSFASYLSLLTKNSPSCSIHVALKTGFISRASGMYAKEPTTLELCLSLLASDSIMPPAEQSEADVVDNNASPTAVSFEERLPPEIRTMIWDLTVGPRTLKMELRAGFQSGKGIYMFSTLRRLLPPACTSVENPAPPSSGITCAVLSPPPNSRATPGSTLTWTFLILATMI